MSNSDIPQQATTRAIMLARLLAWENGRSEVIVMYDSILQELITSFVALGNDTSIPVEASFRIAKIILHAVVSFQEGLYTGERQQVKKFIQHLNALHLDTSQESHDLTTLDKRFDFLISEGKEEECLLDNLSAKDALKRLEETAAILTKFGEAISIFRNLSFSVQKRALDSLALVAQTTDPIAFKRIYDVFAGDL